MDKNITFTVEPSDSGARLDVLAAARAANLTRSRTKSLIEEGLVLVNGRRAKASLKLKAGDRVSVSVPEDKTPLPEPEAIPLEIIHEDDDVIVLNKPAGLTVHPGAGRKSGTLVNALAAHTAELSSVGGELRRGIVHRLDKDTSGVMVVAKNDRSHLSLAAQFKEHSTGRGYTAIVWGRVRDDSGTIDLAIGRDSTHRKKISPRTRKARRAVTRYRVEKRFSFFTVLSLEPETGRTHQLRVHLAAMNHPVAGDPVYCKRTIPSSMPAPVAAALKRIKRQLLHAGVLSFTHPSTGERAEFTSPLPEDMASLIGLMEKEC